MPLYTIETENKQILENAIDLAIASARRAINTQKRPEFKVIYEKEIAVLTATKASIKAADTTANRTK